SQTKQRAALAVRSAWRDPIRVADPHIGYLHRCCPLPVTLHARCRRLATVSILAQLTCRRTALVIRRARTSNGTWFRMPIVTRRVQIDLWTHTVWVLRFRRARGHGEVRPVLFTFSWHGDRDPRGQPRQSTERNGGCASDG